MNWKGVPLVSYGVILNLISGVRTKTGLKISAKMDRRRYETGKKITDAEFKKKKSASPLMISIPTGITQSTRMW